jgi:hypothetical protein
VPLADAVHGRVGSLDVVIALQVPDDANGTHVIRPPKGKDLFDHLIRRLVRMIMRTVLAPREPGFAKLAVPVSPQVESRPRDSEAPAGRVDVPVLLRVLEHSLLAPDFSLIFGQLDPLGHPLSA